MPQTNKRYVSKSAINAFKQQSYEAEQERYDFAKEEFERLERERQQKYAERKAILAERENKIDELERQRKLEEQTELEEQSQKVGTDNVLQSNNVNEARENDSVAGNVEQKNVNNKPVQDNAAQKHNQRAKAFLSSLWMALVNSLRTPLPTPNAIMQQQHYSSNGVKTPAEVVQDVNRVVWTKDAVAAYNIQKNKVEIDKYVGDITVNKEKQQYADVINTYSDNIYDYLQLKKQYDSITGNDLQSRKRRADLWIQMSKLRDWMDDLDKNMQIAKSYNLEYGDATESITSYGSSIGVPFNRNSLSTDATSLLNTFKYLKDAGTSPIKDVSRIENLIKRVKSGYDKFSKKINADNVAATNKMNAEYEDLKQWEEWHTPSAQYRAKEKAAQSNYLHDWDTYAYSFPGTLGSSMSFGGIQMLSTALNMGGAVAIQTGNPYAVAGGVAATLAGAGLGVVSGIHENKSEVGSNYRDAVVKELQDKGLYDDFMHDMEYQMKKKNLFYHKDEQDKINDAFNYFVRGDIYTNDQRVREIATKHLFGANNLFQNDMMAVSADVAFDTGLNLFMPSGSVAKALKIVPVGKFNNYTRALAEFSSEHPLIGKVIRRSHAVQSGFGTDILNAVSPIAGGMYKGAKVAMPAFNKIHKGAEAFAKGMSKGVDKIANFFNVSPASLYKIKTIGGSALDFGGMLLKRGFSEAIEEGKQYKYGERFKEGGFAGKSNTILETLLDDLSTGTSSALAFFGSQFLGIESDSELMSNMRGGFIGGLLNHGTLISAYQQANNTIGEKKAGDILTQNVFFKRIQERGDIINAMKFAKYATNPNKIAQMNAAFDRFESIEESYRQAASEDPSQQYWTKEDIDSQRKLFDQIVQISNSRMIRNGLEQQGVDVDSERGRATVALIAYAMNKSKEDTDISNDHIRQFNQLIDDNRLSVDELGNVKSIVESIASIDEYEGLSEEEREYVKKLYSEIKEADEKAMPKRKGNSRQRRKAETSYKKGALDRIVEKIKNRVEYDKATDAKFAKHHALLKLKNELESIPEDMRTNTQKNQLASVDKQLEDFLKSLGEVERVVHSVQTEDSLFELGKNRGFFNLMSDAYRTIILDKVAMHQNAALLQTLLLGNSQNIMQAFDMSNAVLEEVAKDTELFKTLQKNIIHEKKNSSDFESARKKLVDDFLKSIQDDYALYKQIQDRFAESSELTGTNIGENQVEEALHTRKVSEDTVDNTKPTAEWADALKQVAELQKKEARKAKRRRWKQNKKARERYLDSLNDAFEEPENDELIRDLYDPVDWDELDYVHGERTDQGTLDDYMAQYDDAYEEPWWDELTSQREEAYAEDAAFLDQYNSSNSFIRSEVERAQRLIDTYKINSVVDIVENGKRKRYQVVAVKYNERTGGLVFGLHQVTKKNTLYKNNKVIWVDKNDISNYTITPAQLDVDFGEQPKSLNGITVGDKANMLVFDNESDASRIILNAKVVDILDDSGDIVVEDQQGQQFLMTADQYKTAISDFKNIHSAFIDTLGASAINNDVLAVAEIFYRLADKFGDTPFDRESVADAAAGFYLLQLANNDPEYSNRVDSFHKDKDGKLVRYTRASHAVGDMYELSTYEQQLKSNVFEIFNHFENTEHAINLLQAWYNNTIDENEEDAKYVISLLGKPYTVDKKNLHKSTIDLHPYILLLQNGKLDTVSQEHIADIISTDFNTRTSVNSTTVINDIIERILTDVDVDPREQNQDYQHFLSQDAYDSLIAQIRKFKQECNNQGYVFVQVPSTILTPDYSCEYNMFVVDQYGRVGQIHFPIRWYDYIRDLDDMARTATPAKKHKVKSERQWQHDFAIKSEAALASIEFPTYVGITQVPFMTVVDRRVKENQQVSKITMLDQTVVFNAQGQRIENLTQQEIDAYSGKIKSLCDKIDKKCSAHPDVFTYAATIQMIDDIQSREKFARTRQKNKEGFESVLYYAQQVLQRVTRITAAKDKDDSRQLNPQRTQKTKGRTDIDAMIPQIRAAVNQIDNVVTNISNYTRNGGYIQQQIRDQLVAFLQNESQLRYYEKLKGSQEQSDKDLADKVVKLRQSVHSILQSHTKTFGSIPTILPGDPVLDEPTLVLTQQNRLQLGDILSEPEFAEQCTMRLVYGRYIAASNSVEKLNKKSTETNVGVYAIIEYKHKQYSPIEVVPHHYLNQMNTLTPDGEAFVDDVIRFQDSGDVIAKGVHRMIPNVKYGSTVKPVATVPFLNAGEQVLQTLTPDSDVVGMCRTQGKITRLNSTQSDNPLYVLNEASASQNIGGVFLFINLHFNEYQNGSSKIPVRLVNSKLKPKDVDVIIEILKDVKTRFDNSGVFDLDRPYMLNEKETPFTQRQVLNFLMNFRQDLAKSRIYINSDGTIQFRTSVSGIFGTPVNPLSPEGEKSIREFIQQTYTLTFNHVEVLSEKLSNKNSKLFGKLSQYIEQNKSLEICPSLRFDEADVNMNGEGFYGIGWAIRHGRLLTSASFLYEASIGIDGIETGSSEFNNPGPTAPQPPAPAAPQGNQQIDDFDKWLSSTIGNVSNNTYEAGPASTITGNKTLDKEQALKNIKRMLGEEVPVEIFDDVLDVLHSGASVVGKATVDSIKLSMQAVYGTEYHETFHKVVELLMKPKSRKKIYNIYRKRHPELSNTEIAESMAEDFRIWFTEEKPENFELSWNLIDMFKQVKTWINAIKKIGSFRLAWTYYRINSGAYKNVKPSDENVNRFNRIFGEYAPMTVYDVKNGKEVSIHNITSDRDFNEAIDTISHMIINEYLKDDSTFKVEDVDFSKEGVLKMSGYKYLVGDKTTASNLAFAELFDNWDGIINHVLTRLKQLGLGIRHNKASGKISVSKSSLDSPLDVDKIPEKEEQYTKEGAIAEMMDYVTKESYEISRSKKIKDFVKFVLSQIVDERYVENGDVDENGNQIPLFTFYTDQNGRYVDENGNPGIWVGDHWECKQQDGTVLVGNQIKWKTIKNKISTRNIFGFKKYLSFDEVYNRLLNDLHVVNSVDELMTLLKKLSENDLMYAQIYNKIVGMYNNMLYVDKDGFYHDTNGSLWRRSNRITDDGYVYLKVGSDKRPIEIPEDTAIARHVNYKVGDKYYMCMTENQIPLQYNWNNVALVAQLFNAISGSKQTFMMTVTKRDSNSYITHDVTDTDSGHTARRYSQHWFLSFISNAQKVEKYNVGDVIKHRTKDAKLFDNVYEFLSTIRDAYVSPKGRTSRTNVFQYKGKTYNIVTDVDLIKRMLIQHYNSIGIQIDKKIFDHLLYSIFGDTGYVGMFGYLCQNGDKSGIKKGVSIELFLKSLKDVQKGGVFERSLENGAFFTNNGVVSQLANAKYSYNTSHKSGSVIAPGNNKYYVQSEKNTITFITEELSNPNSQLIQDVKHCPYYTYIDPLTGVSQNTFILENVLQNGCKVKFVNDVGYRNDDVRGDYGSDYMQIGSPEDIIGKMSFLQKDYMIFPAMSNKKTYGAIYLEDKNGNRVHIPGIKFIHNWNDPNKNVYKAEGIPQIATSLDSDGKPITRGTYSKYHFILSEEVYDRLITYANMEYQTVKYGQRIVNEMEESEKVENLHKASGKTKQSSAGICRFPRFYGIFKKKEVRDKDNNIIIVDRDFVNFNDNNESDDTNIQTAEAEFFGESISKTQKKAIINELVMNQLDKYLRRLEDAGIIKKRQGWRSIQNPYLIYDSDVIDSSLLNSIVVSQNDTLDGRKLSASESRSLAIVTILLDTMIKHQISMEEIQRFYVGHPGEFETYYDESGRITDDEKDMSKRLGGLVSTGETNALGIMGMRTKYVCAEMDDYKVSSPQYQEFKQAFYESELRYTLFNTYLQDIDDILQRITSAFPNKMHLDEVESIIEELDQFDAYESGFHDEIRQVFTTDGSTEDKRHAISEAIYEYKESVYKQIYDKQKNYSLDQVKDELSKLNLLTDAEARAGSYAQSYESKINVGDGASYVSPKMVKDMLIQLGLFKGEVVKAYDYLNKGISEDILADAKACSIIMQAMLGAQKYTAYGYRMHKGFPEFYYNKTALFPMFRQLCTTPKLKALYDKMTKSDPLDPADKPVDMLMFKSSVKVGSRGSQKLPEDIKELDKLKLNKYEQSFKFLIKQLNTDPKDREHMAMGTQALKVVMSLLNKYITDYQLRNKDGYLSDKTCTGKELLSRIMNDRKNIIELKVTELYNKFYTETGSKNQNEFVKWMISNLTDRDVSDDMLKALEVDSEHNKRRAKLGAMSDGGWVQSIVASLINKDLIDFNLPGNMFIQRSVFGMEGKVLSDKYVPSINNGERLQLVNERGSMDAVISIDYFVEMFPEQLKGKSFKEQRQWLLDKNIIGKNSKSNCVSYRIPTQAASSISALRFVDVLNTVRDTIVLPEEFTALTGSDFDIDKLFFSFKNLRIDENGNVSEDFEEGSVEAYQNDLIESFITLLSQDRNKFGNISLRSIDKDTEIGKSVAEELTSGKKYVDPYDAMSMWKQLEIKEINRTGSVGIGPSALNNSNHNHTRLYDVHFVNRGIIKMLGISNLSAELDVESKSVLGLIGAYINGNVDNAKDPWVGIVNLNQYTYNVSNMLARCGFGRSALYFTAQPIMRELSKIHTYAEGTLYKTENETSYEMEERLKEEMVSKYFGDASRTMSAHIMDIMRAIYSNPTGYDPYTKYSDKAKEAVLLVERTYAIIKTILGIDPDNTRRRVGYFYTVGGNKVQGSILRDAAIQGKRIENGDEITTETAINDDMKRYKIDIKYADKEETLELSARDVQLYVYILNELFEPYSKALSSLVQYTKIDTKKQGRSVAEQYCYRYNYNKLKNNKLFDNNLYNMLIDTYIDKLTLESTNMYRKILEDEYIEASAPMATYDNPLTWVSSFLKYSRANVKPQVVKKMIDGITSYIKNRYFIQYAKDENINIKDLFIGDNSIYNQLAVIKSTILENPQLYKEYIDSNGCISNALLEQLEPSVIDAESFEDAQSIPKFVEILKDEDESNSINAIRNSWTQLLTDAKHPELQRFARRLVVYAFITSGDTNINGSIFRYVPFSWRDQISAEHSQLSYVDYINNYIDNKNDEFYMEMQKDSKERRTIPICDEFRNSNVFASILLNNWNDHELVPTLQKGKGTSNYTTLTLDPNRGNPDILIAANLTIALNTDNVAQYYASNTKYEGAPLIVKTKKPGHASNNQEDFYFYQLYAFGKSIKKSGQVFNYPIYKLINPKGFYYYGHKIFEYVGKFGLDESENYYLDESKLTSIRDLVDWWNQQYSVQPPEGTPVPLHIQQTTKEVLTRNEITSDRAGLIYMLCASMSLYESFSNKEPVSETETQEPDTKRVSKIEYAGHVVSRQEAINNPTVLYIFTDNTNRTSGSNVIDRNSPYYKKYGNGQDDLYYPNSTRAVLRGLPNAFPISTQRFFDVAKGLVGKNGRWTNDSIEEFKKIIDDEIDEIIQYSSKYDKIVISGTSLFGGNISDIQEEGDRSEMFKYLSRKLEDLRFSIDGVANYDQYYYPGKPTLNSIPNWSPGSIFYAGVGSRETPEDVLQQMREVAKELEQAGYVLRSGAAKGADRAFASGVQNSKNLKEYFAEDIKLNTYGNAEQTDKLLKETHPKESLLVDYSRQLQCRDAYQVFGEHLDSPSAFVLCWTKDAVTSYEQTTADTGGTGQAIRLASRKGIPVINMANPEWRTQLDEVLQRNMPRQTREVWWGSNGEGPNAELSNMAPREFVLSETISQRIDELLPNNIDGVSISSLMKEYMNGRKFKGVEQAFHLAKFAALYIHVANQTAQRLKTKNYETEADQLAAELDIINKRIAKNNIGEDEAEALRQETAKKVHDAWTEAQNSQFNKQQQKYILDSIRKAMEEVANAKTNKESKRKGKIRIADVFGVVYNYWNGVWSNSKGLPDPTTLSYKIMGLLQIDSFMQNKTKAAALVNTGNDKFTHSKGGEWATAFPQVLTKTRNYIRQHINDSDLPSIRTSLVIANSSRKDDMNAAAEASGGVITTRQNGQKFHFGNPFSHNSNWGIVTGNGTISDAVKAFDAWLGGTAYQDVEPERRQWILDMISSGELDEAPLVYYTTHATDKEGTHVYDYTTFPNHAHILLKYINMHIANPEGFIENFASPLEAKSTLESEKTILSNEELAEWNKAGITNPKILVASEHSDPAFFAQMVVDVIEGKRKVIGHGFNEGEYTGHDFNGLYIITKHDGQPIRKILETKIPKLIHFSVTGLGQTAWEPNSMKYTDMLDRIEALIKDGLDPNCVTMRIDPIIPGVTLVKDIEEIMKRSAKMGIKRVKFSVCDMYPGGYYKENGVKKYKHNSWEVALDLTEQKYGKAKRDELWNTLVSVYGLNPADNTKLNKHAPQQRIEAIANVMVQFAEKYGLTLSSCAENINHPKVQKTGCLAVSQVNEMLGTSVEDRGFANNRQRSLCSCFGGKIDLLPQSGTTCATSCTYCYMGHGRDANPWNLYYNQDGTLRDIPLTRTQKPDNEIKSLMRFDKDALREMGAEVLKYCNKHR